MLALCRFVSLAVILDLRLLGKLLRDVPVSQVIATAAVDARRLHRDGDHGQHALLRDSHPHLPKRVVPRESNLPDSRRPQRVLSHAFIQGGHVGRRVPPDAPGLPGRFPSHYGSASSFREE
jgi:hypothetical protein